LRTKPFFDQHLERLAWCVLIFSDFLDRIGVDLQDHRYQEIQFGSIELDEDLGHNSNLHASELDRCSHP
jgi:hypothetical protein